MKGVMLSVQAIGLGQLLPLVASHRGAALGVL
jgi:hypothetical protein